MDRRITVTLLVLVRFLTRPRNLGAITACIFSTALVVAAVTPVVDPDVWWVAAAGREMLATHAVPRVNLFSFVEPHHPWLMHEWLFGPIYALGLDRFGPSFFNAIAMIVMSVELALVTAGTIGRARNPAAGMVMALSAVLFFGARFLSARPTGVALIFPIALSLVAFAPRFTWGSMALAGLIELVWANAHGSFPLGVVLLLVAAADRKKDRGRRIAAAAVATLATTVTPYGLALHRFVWGYFRGGEGVYRAIHAHIKEFGTLHSAWGYTVGAPDLVAFVLFLVLAAGAATERRYRARALLCLALFALGAVHVRHLELAGLLSCVLLLPYVDELAARFAPPPVESTKTWRGNRLAIAALVLAPAYAFAIGAYAVTHHRRSPDAWVGAGAALLRSIAAIPDGANAFIPFSTAGVGIWYGFPRGVRVFFDPRNDCYSAEAFAAFWSLETDATPEGDRRRVLDEAGTDAALVPSRHPLAAFLEAEPGWQLTRLDEDWRVFRRAR